MLLRIVRVRKLTSKYFAAFGFIAVLFAIAVSMATAAQDKYTVAVQGGLAFSEFRGYEDWQPVSVSKTDRAISMILANPVMIEAFRSGIPGNGKPFPDGSKITKLHYKPLKSGDAPNPTTEVPGTLVNIDFIEKDSKRFPDGDSGGWGYAVFDYNAASDTFTPGNENDTPPQSNDARCGVACHSIAQAKNYIFTEYSKR
jgi:hypothetical protein